MVMKDAGGSDDNGEDVDDEDDGRRTNIITSFYARIVHRNYIMLLRVYVIIRK